MSRQVQNCIKCGISLGQTGRHWSCSYCAKLIARQRKRMRSSSMLRTMLLEALLRLQGGVCGICNYELSISEAVVDHIVPISQLTRIPQLSDVQAAHSDCNQLKAIDERETQRLLAISIQTQRLRAIEERETQRQPLDGRLSDGERAAIMSAIRLRAIEERETQRLRAIEERETQRQPLDGRLSDDEYAAIMSAIADLKDRREISDGEAMALRGAVARFQFEAKQDGA